MFKNIISCRSSCFDLLRSKTRSKVEFDRFFDVTTLQTLYFLSDCHETSHTCSQTSSLVRVSFLTFSSQKNRSISNLTDLTAFLFLIRLSRTKTHMFTNIISCTSLLFDLLWSKSRSTSNLTDLTEFLFSIRLSRNFTHVFTNIISCTSLCFDLLWSKTRSTSNLTDFCFLSDCHKTSHTCSQTLHPLRVHVSTSCGKN